MNTVGMVVYCKKPSQKQSLSCSRVVTAAKSVFNINFERFIQSQRPDNKGMDLSIMKTSN